MTATKVLFFGHAHKKIGQAPLGKQGKSPAHAESSRCLCAGQQRGGAAKSALLFPPLSPALDALQFLVFDGNKLVCLARTWFVIGPPRFPLLDSLRPRNGLGTGFGSVVRGFIQFRQGRDGSAALRGAKALSLVRIEDEKTEDN